MDQFARIVVGFHGCTDDFARDLLMGKQLISTWQPSTNDWDWLGHGIYFWEHSPDRALRWAHAVIQLGRCFDLLNEAITSILTQSFQELAQAFAAANQPLPTNLGNDLKRRELDCLVINDCLRRLQIRGIEYDTVRGAFLEGDAVYPGAGFFREAHIQIAVRNPTCILGVFRPNLNP
jgi:hypothetical protein